MVKKHTIPLAILALIALAILIVGGELNVHFGIAR